MKVVDMSLCEGGFDSKHLVDIHECPMQDSLLFVLLLLNCSLILFNILPFSKDSLVLADELRGWVVTGELVIDDLIEIGHVILMNDVINIL